MIPTARSVLLPRQPRGAATQRDLEARFFRGLRLRNGTYKTTGPSRLTDVDRAVVDLLGVPRRIALLDVGISSGVTTLDTLNALGQAGMMVELVGSDLYLRASLVHTLGFIDVLLDTSGYPLQLATPFLVKCRPHKPRGAVRRRVLDWLFDRVGEHVRGGPERGTPVQLVARQLADRSEVALEEHDIQRPRPEWDGTFDVVRAANILNLDYFAPAVLREMARNLLNWTTPGGLLVICRTLPDDSNHATVFRREEDGPKPLARVGSGSELEHLITNLTASLRP